MRDKDVVAVSHGQHGVTELVIMRYHRRNALSFAVIDAIRACIDACQDRGQRVLVIRGDRGFFSAGADIAEMTGLPADQFWDAQLETLVGALSTSPVVTVAAIEGGCVGAGLELAVACDLRVAGPASFFAIPALEMGLVYRPSAVNRVMGLIGPAAATRLLLLGERLSGTEAHACGLATTIAADDEVRRDAVTIAERLCRAPSTALSATARMMSSFVGSVGEHGDWLDDHRQSFASAARYQAVARKHRRPAKEST